MTELLGRLSLPAGVGRTMISAAAIAWLGALIGGQGGWWLWIGLASAVGLLAGTRLLAPAGLMIGAVLSGWLAVGRVEATLTATVPAGPVHLVGVVADEPVRIDDTLRFVLRARCRVEQGRCVPLEIPPVAVETGSLLTITAGDPLEVEGVLLARPGRVRGDPVAGAVRADEIVLRSSGSHPLFVLGNAMRKRVTSRLAGRTPASAAGLMAGLLIGDTSQMASDDLDALRRSGLTHFVAVSGSNVALFLVAWWVLAAPFLRGPRLRNLWGLVGLALFVVVTRWEASVVRAATMAGLILVGRVVAIPLDAWTALGAAVVGLLLLSGDLAGNVGFQLSVAATAGVLAGARIFADRRPRLLWAALGATVSAQSAVTPLLMLHFGSVPLLSPVANVLAAPLVAVATTAGGLGTLTGLDWLLAIGLMAATGVLQVAHLASDWPQLGWVELVAVAGAGLSLRYRIMRPIAVVVLVALVTPVVGPYRPPRDATVTVLDVGQGDAVLIETTGGDVMLVDGGNDPGMLRAKLRQRRIGRVDVLVVTHGDEDHLGGLIGLPTHLELGEVWVPDQPEPAAELIRFIAEVEGRGTLVEAVRAGVSKALGEFAISVLGPQRRYAAENDGSVVLLLEANGHTMLLAGDVEAVAQADLDVSPVDVLLVPHHGSATSDLQWLGDLEPTTALVSVGPNNYGHPAPGVLAVLRRGGSQVLTTFDHGDIAVPFPEL